MSQFKRFVAITAALLMTLSMVPSAFAAGTYFDDVDDSSEFAMYINGLAAEGVVTGLNGRYYPLLNVTRAELAKFAIEGAGLELTVAAGAPHFTDMPATHSLYNYVEAAYANGIVQGRAPGMYAPDAYVTRGEATKIIVGTFRTVDENDYFMDNLVGGPHFQDVPASHEFYPYVETLYNLGIIRGYGNGRFGLQDPTRRDQMAKIVYGAMQVLRNGPPSVPVGAPARLRLESSESMIYPDGFSTATINGSVLDSNGEVVGGYNGPVTCTTDLGTLVKEGDSQEDGSDSITVGADSGRMSAHLYSAREEGTATITCETGTLEEAVVQVEFSREAPRVRNGFGTDSISGVGTIEMILTDDRITTDLTADDFTTVFNPIRGGCSLVEVYVFDDEGDPMNDDEIQLTITGGSGHLQAGFCTSQPTSGTRSIRVNTSDNGRATAYFVGLADQQEGEVEITAQNLDTSPTLQTDATLETVNLTLDAEVFPFDGAITTRNDSQITGDDALVINQAIAWIRLLDENGDPVEDADAHDIQARFVGGPTGGARLVGCTSNTTCATATNVGTEVYLQQVDDGSSQDIPGLYAVKVLAGTGEGTLEIEVRDETAIGQPSVTFEVEVAEPVLDCFTSAEEIDEDPDSAAVICRLTTEDGVAITGESLECQIQGGDGGVDVNPADNDPTATTVTMEAVDTQTGGAGLGWYWCQYESEASVPGDDTITIRITDLDRSSLPSTTVAITATDDNEGAITQLQVEALETDLGPLNTTSVLVIVQDNDENGVDGLAVTGSTGSGAGLVRVNMNTLTNMTLQSPMIELGDGAYFFNTTSANVDDEGEVEVELYDTEDVFVEDVEIPFHVIDHVVTSEATRSDILVDEAFGIVACVEDENENPVAGLSASWTITNEGVATTRTTMNEIMDSGDVTGIAGSGCYAMSVDTDPTVQPGNDVVIRTSLTAQPTNPDDTVEVGIEDVTLELMAHPDFMQATNCVLISAIVRDQDGDQVDIDTPGTNGVRLQITDGSGGLKNGDTGTCTLSGSSTSMFMTLNVGTSAVANGVYIATYISSVIEESVEITGYVEGANSRAEDTITLDIG